MGWALFKSLSLHCHHCVPQGLHLNKKVVEYILSSHVKDHASKDATHTHPHQGSQEEGEGVSSKAARRETGRRGREGREEKEGWKSSYSHIYYMIEILDSQSGAIHTCSDEMQSQWWYRNRSQLCVELVVQRCGCMCVCVRLCAFMPVTELCVCV